MPDSSIESLSSIIKNVTVDDLVCIAWIQDIISMHNIPQKIGQSVLVYIFVHPLQNATGLYWVRIVIPATTHQGTTSGLGEKKGGKGRVSWSADTAKLADNPLVSFFFLDYLERFLPYNQLKNFNILLLIYKLILIIFFSHLVRWLMV